jgi:SulP family sulfate permease
MRLALRIVLSLRNWQNLVPLVPTLRHYRRQDLSHDFLAGLVVGMVTIPQAVAYAYLAGVPPQSGLYACLLPMVIYAILGSSKQMVVGPVAVAALLVAATVGDYAPKYSDAYLGITSILCLQIAAILWLLQLSQMGGLVNLLSHPVITGFINAAAILIIISQLPGLSGIDLQDAQNPMADLLHVISQVKQLDMLTFSFGVVTLIFLLLSKKFIAKSLTIIGLKNSQEHPAIRTGPMLASIVSIILITSFDLSGEISTVGFVPAGLPSFAWPDFDIVLWLDLMPTAAIIAIITYIESYSIGTTLAAKKQTKINPHQELFALGAANMGAAVTGAYPVAGSFSRSSVNFSAGARTPVSSLFCAIIVVLTLSFLTDVFANLPKSVLAAIVIVSVFGLIDFKSAIRHWSLYRQDSWTEMATMTLVLFFGVEVGLLAGVGLSIAFFIRSSSHPNITQVGRIGESPYFRSVKRFEVTTYTNILALRVDENIYFANATQIEDRLLRRALRRNATQHLVIVCSSINMIDATGLMMLYRLNSHLAAAGITLNLSDVKGPLMRQLSATDIVQTMSGEFFFSADEAIKYLTGSGGSERLENENT